MNIQSMSVSMEKYVMPLANKLGNEIHLRAIRDAFMSLLPITFTGGIAAVLSSAPSVDAAGTGITLAWARFVESNSMIFSWINALTLGAMSLYICIGIIHFLCKSRKIESFLPIRLGVCGFLILIVEPMSRQGIDSGHVHIYSDRGFILLHEKTGFWKNFPAGYGASFPFRCICLHRAGGGADGNLYSIVRHNE